MQGKFLVIEGLEGAGKSTAMAECETQLAARNIPFIKVREPGGTPLAEQLRLLVKAEHSESIAPETELLLMYAARAQLLHNVVRPALAEGKWVLSDRHDWSSQAYQGGGRGLSEKTLGALAEIVLKDLKPDLILYLDIDPAQGLARARGRGELDRIEQEALSFFERTRAQYQKLAAAADNAVTIDAGAELAVVTGSIRQALTEFLTRSC
ncbi:dTMP kinase [Pseudoalteromonas fenneropenaei]|uniref:Thymidylate kinase n=1 Tax=Pseudoalteromonas fenneropenaei TaxID=1737459 RepID=A0ABV7CF17_9GAMM